MSERVELINKLKAHAKKNNVKLNPNDIIREALINGLLRNKEEFGDFYCPCRNNHSKENVCPCNNHLEEIEKEGHCHCWLFVKDDK